MGDAAYCDMCKWLFQLSKYKKVQILFYIYNEFKYLPPTPEMTRLVEWVCIFIQASGRIMAAEIYGQMLVKKDLKKISGIILM